MVDLESIYHETLRRCAPETLVREVLPGDDEEPRHVVAVGKSAGRLLDGVATLLPIDDALAVVPHGYPAPAATATVLHGGHPEMDEHSFAAGRELIHFVETRNDVLFLISGGGSACVEAPLDGWFTNADLVDVNHRLLSAGLPIGDINTVRKHLSSIKGGRLGARVRGRNTTLLYSDVGSGDLGAVASGPTIADVTTNEDAAIILERIGGCDRLVSILRDPMLPETIKALRSSKTILVADNATLVAVAANICAERGLAPIVVAEQIAGDVETAAIEIARRADRLGRNEVLIAGGEPTVVTRGSGRGGRCSELAVRFALHYRGAATCALFGSSDGLDGNSGAAAIVIDRLPAEIDREEAAAALADCNSFAMATKLGHPVIIQATGNNLRDLYLVARP